MDTHTLTTRDVAERFKTTRLAVYMWRTEGQLPFATVDGQVRFTAEDVDAFAATRTTI